MTVKNWKKVFVQLKAKQTKLKKYIKHNAPKKRSTGRALTRCRLCGRTGGHIGQYGLKMCRHCFREIATEIGFKKYN